MIGLSVRWRICSISRRAISGDPSASITITPVGPMTKPAFEMKFWLAGDPISGSPCTKYVCGATSTGVIAGWATPDCHASTANNPNSAQILRTQIMA